MKKIIIEAIIGIVILAFGVCLIHYYTHTMSPPNIGDKLASDMRAGHWKTTNPQGLQAPGSSWTWYRYKRTSDGICIVYTLADSFSGIIELVTRTKDGSNDSILVHLSTVESKPVILYLEEQSSIAWHKENDSNIRRKTVLDSLENIRETENKELIYSTLN